MDKHDMPPNSISDKKKRGRKKNIVVESINAISSKQTSHQDQDQNQDNNDENVVVVVVDEMTKEKKQRKKRTNKGEAANANDKDKDKDNDAGAGADMTDTILEIANVNEPTIKKRKRRTRKDIENAQNADKNLIISSTNNGTEHQAHANAQAHGENSSDTQLDESAPKEEKVAKKRGRKPKGGKITIQPQTNSNIQNELPNIILHLKCSLSDLNKNNSEIDETFDTKNNANTTNNNVNNTNNTNNNNNNNNANANNACANTTMETIQSYNSINAIGSEINNNSADDSTFSVGANIQLYHRDLLKKSQNLSNVHEMITRDDSHSRGTNTNTNTNTNGAANALNETYSSAMFPVYDPCIPNDTNTHSLPPPIIRGTPSYYDGSNQIINKNQASPFSTIYSPDIISYNNNTHTSAHDDDSLSNSANLNEREIWKKINQLKLSFHKSDICQNIRGAQRSACFWCTCEFDSPAIYIPKSVLKDMYNVYGCFCSPECGAAFLMNESIDTSTKFERYHLLNSLYGKIYKHEKSIKIAPNPYYLLNKFYGTLTIQEYRKLFQSDQMIYVVNKPLTHILPELYEDNNDFLLNNKIIPTNSVNLKKKVLKSNL
jgi:hypothetical protein